MSFSVAGQAFFLNNMDNKANLDNTEYKLTIDSSRNITIGFLLGNNSHGRWIELVISKKVFAQLKKLGKLSL